MPEYTYGEISDWTDVDVGGGSDFMRLVEGNNVVRVFTKPYQFYVCWIKDASGANRKVKSAVKNCPLIKRGEKVQKRWLMGAIDRKGGNKAKILEVSSQIMLGIKSLAADPDWGNPIGYDVNVNRGAPGKNPLYHVIAKPQKPLTDEDKAEIEQFMKNTDLAVMTTPPSPEQVAEQLREIDGGLPAGNGNGSQRQQGGQQKQDSGSPNIDPSVFNFDEEGSQL